MDGLGERMRVRVRVIVMIAAVVASLVGVTPSAQARVADSWSVDQTPNPGQGETGHLNAVSCATATFCVAVGSTGPAGVPFANIGSGTNWTLSTPTVPKSNPSHELNDVSCVSTSFCIAVGGGYPPNTSLTERWTGTRWAYQLNPLPDSKLTAVSCTSARFCMATDGYQPIVWNGSSWQAQPAWSGLHATDLSCSSATRCMAVGYGGTSTRTSARLWDGSQWTDVTSTVFTHVSYVTGVSCVRTTCVVVGGHGADTNSVFIAEYVGSHWQPVNEVDNITGGLGGISCPDPNSCVALGSTGGSVQNLTLVLDGAGWHTGVPTGEYVRAGIDCRAGPTCVVVGGDRDTPTPLILNQTADGQWTDGHAVGYPVVPASHANDISCVSSFCVAVGSRVVSGGTSEVPYAARWDGTAWRVDDLPGFKSPTADTVWCLSASFCAAVGGLPWFPVSWIWNGSAWRQVNLIPIKNAVIASVACASPTDCLAVGRRTGSGGGSVALVEGYNGQKWSIVTAPKLTGDDAALTDVTCPTATLCLASGISAPHGTDVGAVATLTGSTWTVTTFADESAVSSISCATATFCVAAGVGARRVVVVKQYDGSAWSDVSVAGLSSARTIDVSCGSTSRCLLVDAHPAAAVPTTAARWDGLSWTSAPPATPADAPDGFALVSASCTSTYCKAAGNRVNGQPYQLIETLS